MRRRYALVVTAAVVGVVSSLTRHLAALLQPTMSSPSPRALTLSLQLGQFVSFLCVYGLLFGVAYWVGQELADRRDSVVVAVATGVGGTLGYLAGFFGVVYPAGAIAFPGVLVSLVLVLGPPLGVGVKVGVVAFAGSAVSLLQ